MTVENEEGKQEQSPEELFEAMSSAISSNDEDAIRKLADENAEPVEPNTPKAEEEVEKEEPKVEPEEETSVEEGSEEAAKTNEVAAPAASEPDYKKELEDAKRQIHRLQSDAGRVPFLQRRLAELERQGRSNTSGRETPKADIDPNETIAQKLARYKEIDPELADVLSDIIRDARTQAMTHSQQSIEEMREIEEEAENQRFYNEQIALLAEAVPQHKQIFAMPEWSQWKDSLTPGQRAMAESSYASEVTQAIYAFGNYMKARQGQATQQQPPAKTEEAKKVQAQREKRQESSPSSKSTPAKKEKEFDADAYFAEQFGKIMKENHLA